MPRLNTKTRIGYFTAQQRYAMTLSGDYQPLTWRLSDAAQSEGFAISSNSTTVYPPEWARAIQISVSVLANGVSEGAAIYVQLICGSYVFLFVPVTSTGPGWLGISVPPMTFPKNGNSGITVQVMRNGGSGGELSQQSFSRLSVVCFE